MYYEVNLTLHIHTCMQSCIRTNGLKLKPYLISDGLFSKLWASFWDTYNALPGGENKENFNFISPLQA